MNGYEIYRKAISLMGLNNCGGDNVNRNNFTEAAFNSLCHICTDLGIAVPDGISDEVKANALQLDACISGVAMLLSLSAGDSNANALFAEIYNSKRASVKSSAYKIKDVLPFDNGSAV